MSKAVIAAYVQVNKELQEMQDCVLLALSSKQLLTVNFYKEDTSFSSFFREVTKVTKRNRLREVCRKGILLSRCLKHLTLAYQIALDLNERL